jgi:hypothetical protein
MRRLRVCLYSCIIGGAPLRVTLNGAEAEIGKNMQPMKLSLILGASSLCALLVLAQTSPVEKFERGNWPHPENQQHFIAGAQDPSLRAEIRVFYINNVQYWARISEDALLSSPDWAPSKPLPLDFAKAEAIAREELRKLISDDSTWEVTGFHLRSVRDSTPDMNELRLRVSSTPKWYFQVELKPVSGHRPEGAGQRSDSFWVFIDLSGQAGNIQAHKEP